MKFKHIHIRRLIRIFKEDWIRVHCVFLVKYLYGDICARKSIGYRAQLFYTHITLCETYEVFIKEPRAQALCF